MENDSFITHEEYITYSLEERSCDCITISSLDGLLEETEKSVKLLHLDCNERIRIFKEKNMC